jgi:1-acyl-sn-glycerol-3-phosphate acyltransferase
LKAPDAYTIKIILVYCLFTINHGKLAVQKDPFLYSILKKYVTWCFHLFYRTEVNGLEKIPANTPLIFIANHQNALMDALAILCTCKKNPYFLARSDVFNNPFVARILYFFKMIPVFRFRDGYDQLKKNEAIFEKSCQVLANGEALVIMPEGNHDPRKRLRAFKKGLAKIAFSIYETGYQGDAFIIPVGLEYASHHSPFSNLLIQYGDPVPIQNYLEEHRSEPVKTERLLLTKSHERLKSLVIHIEDEEVYKDYIRWIYWHQIMHTFEIMPLSQKKQFDIQKNLIEEIDQFRLKQPLQYQKCILQQIATEGYLLQKGCAGNAFIFSGYKLKSCLLAIAPLIILFPIFLYGWLLWIIPFGFGQLLARRMKDKQFTSSMAFVAELTFFAIQSSILTVVLIAGMKSIFPGILFLFSLYPAKKIRTVYHYLFEKVKKCFKMRLILHFSPETYRRINEMKIFFKKKFHY